MIDYLQHLKRSTQCKSNRWIVKLNDKGLIKEVKLIFNPKEYVTLSNARKLLKRKELINILENDKAKRKAE
jgi:hypothetical protein